MNLAPARETAIADELADHLEQRYRDLLARGTDADAAAKSVLDELENEGILADRLKQTRQPIDRAQGSVADGFWHDCRVAIRMMKKRPGFTAAIAGMLALGVAGNAAMFSIFNGLFLRPCHSARPSAWWISLRPRRNGIWCGLVSARSISALGRRVVRAWRKWPPSARAKAAT